MNQVLRARVNACLPQAPLHRFSQEVLNLYVAGRMPTSEFRRWFHMPNTDYLHASDCVAQVMDPAYVPDDPCLLLSGAIPPSPFDGQAPAGASLYSWISSKTLSPPSATRR